MTYSLNTLNADRANAPPSGLARFAHEMALVAGAAALGFWLLALLSHSLSDPAWSTTGSHDDVGNWGGQLGAWLADGSYYLLGFSVWWLVLAGARVSFDCEVSHVHDWATHHIVIGSVRQVHVDASTKPSLVYVDGSYRAIG